jgi:hypothetical protein
MRRWFFARWLVGSQDELIDQLANRLFRNVLFYLVRDLRSNPRG